MDAGIVAGNGPSSADLLQARQLFLELPEALAHLLSHGTLAPGRYEYANPLVQLPDLVHALPDELRVLAVEETVVFDFSEQHDRCCAPPGGGDSGWTRNAPTGI